MSTLKIYRLLTGIQMDTETNRYFESVNQNAVGKVLIKTIMF